MDVKNNIKQRLIKIDDWLKIRDNPLQRDTVKHAKRAKKLHLRELHPTHLKVSMAEDPKGTTWMLDGHTRSFLWSEGELEKPSHVQADVYLVKNRAEAADLYKAFDNSSAAETIQQKLIGAFRYNSIPHNAKLWDKGGTITAMKALSTTKGSWAIHDLVYIVKQWKKELTIIDGLALNYKNFPAPVIAAMLLTIRMHGESAASFWKLFNKDRGVKNAKSQDGVYAATDFLRKAREEKALQRGGSSAINVLTPKLVWSFDMWWGDRRITRIPFSYDEILDLRNAAKVRIMGNTR